MKVQKTLNILAFGILSISLSGCFEEEMTCNNQTTQSLVKELSEL